MSEAADIVDGVKEDIKYRLYSEEGSTTVVQGSGFLNKRFFTNPSTPSLAIEFMRWSEFAESIRKIFSVVLL